jgi:hypothetical protein
LAEAGRRLKYRLPPQHPAAEALFLQHLAQQRIANPYAQRHETYYWRFNFAARIMRSSGIALVAVGVLSALYNLGSMLDLDQQTDTVAAQAKAVEEETRAIRGTFPPLPASPDTMRAAVEAGDFILGHFRSPKPMLSLIGQALASQPYIQINRVQWWVTPNPEAAQDNGGRGPAPVPAQTVPVADSLYQVVLLEGEVKPFTSNRSAVTAVESLATALNGIPGVKATPVSLPLESASQSQIRGTTDAGGTASASFILKLVYLPGTP